MSFSILSISNHYHPIDITELLLHHLYTLLCCSISIHFTFLHIQSDHLLLCGNEAFLSRVCLVITRTNMYLRMEYTLLGYIHLSSPLYLLCTLSSINNFILSSTLNLQRILEHCLFHVLDLPAKDGVALCGGNDMQGVP